MAGCGCKAPAELRAAGLITLLRGAGHQVVDYGDWPVHRWTPHRDQRRPHNTSTVVAVLRDAQDHIASILADGYRPLVVGGECTLAIALVSAAIAADQEVGVLYVDGGQDLLNLVDHPLEPILDGMGVAHMLDHPGTAEELAGFGPRRPLLTPDHLCFFGQGDADEDLHARVPSPRFPATTVATEPEAAAQQAVATLTAVTERFVVHFDVDVINFFDLPAADVPQYTTGLTLAQAMTALRVMAAHPGFAGMTLTEFNPDHGAPDGSTGRTLAAAIATALG